jgi:hypothetical protein
MVAQNYQPTLTAAREELPMTMFTRTTTLLTLGAIAFSLSACGTSPANNALSIRSRAAAVVVAQGVPPATAFVTITAKVTTIQPDDTSGLPHQKFIVTEISPNAGKVLQVANDTQFGSKVLGLTVGETLVLKGVTWNDPSGGGIHWTHHASKPGDAGFIKTPDGHIYE